MSVTSYTSCRYLLFLAYKYRQYSLEHHSIIIESSATKKKNHQIKMQLLTIAYALMNATASAIKPEGCFHPSKVMQFRSVLKKEFGMNLHQLSYDQMRKVMRQKYVCNFKSCIVCGDNYVYVLKQ